MKELKITNIVKFYTMLLLYENPKHGYEIIKEISDKLGKKVSAGQIYPFLKMLERKRYIKSAGRGVRDKKTYRLTKTGNSFVKKMLNRFGDLIDIAVEPRLTTCIHCGCEVYKKGHKEKIKGRLLAFCCHHCAESYKKG